MTTSQKLIEGINNGGISAVLQRLRNDGHNPPFIQDIIDYETKRLKGDAVDSDIAWGKNGCYSKLIDLIQQNYD